MTSFIKALMFVVVAEMGDKTQLLAMAMAGKYKIKQVLLGVFVATVVNHGIAVAAGKYLGSLIPMGTIRIVAAASFILFGLWTLRGDKIDDDKEKKSKFGPVITVAIAFFMAEMGDKTQLMTIAIAAQSAQPVLVLLGTTTGMMIADGIGIIGGAWMCKHIPDKYIKWGAGIIFIFFGTLTFYEAVPTKFLNPVYIIIYFIVIILGIYIAGVKFSYESQLCNLTDKNKQTNEA
ncbi:TMEM165/GDT1 family protein [Clostridium oryzae]|uniref:GDT1 family protein n=1 Tax=Clostridium oryzae TaxID=1450648 RepID=A0A1V4IYS9_9CLOT|nr:TMEM165/GDT1 family protein [Clostridium oryzae]OPJ65096.1 hypothetical protein CLORY_00960 [Clostridium oryzae]